MTTKKPTNPKDAFGIRKWRQFSFVPLMPVAEAGIVMMTGAKKYGPFNWRESGVRASVYFDAAIGHLLQWWEGESFDPESRVSHLAHAIASILVLRDAQMHSNWIDDRCHGKHNSLDFLCVRDDLQTTVDRIIESWERDEEQGSKEAEKEEATAAGAEGPFPDPEAAWVTVHVTQHSNPHPRWAADGRHGPGDREEDRPHAPDKDDPYRP